jgi:hypothetical protein
MSSVPREALPQKHVRGLPNYDLPLILLAWLAVDLRFAGKGIGHALISEAFRISLRVSREVGCRCVITAAYRDRKSWMCDTVLSQSGEPRPEARMFLDIRTIRKARQGAQLFCARPTTDAAKLGTDMNFRRRLPEIRCLSPVCPTGKCHRCLLGWAFTPRNSMKPVAHALECVPRRVSLDARPLKIASPGPFFDAVSTPRVTAAYAFGPCPACGRTREDGGRSTGSACR